MKCNVLFVSIFDLTRVFFEVCKSLRTGGHNVFWMTTSELWTGWLLDQGEHRESVLELVYDQSAFLTGTERERTISAIVKCERNTGMSVNECMMMDRFVLYKNRPDINEYMYLYYRDIKQFLTDHQITHVFAEPTNTNELLTCMICRDMGIKFLAPRDMRFPHRRLVFTRDFQETRLSVSTTRNSAKPQVGRVLLEEFEESKSVPFTFKKYSAKPVVDSQKAAESTIRRIKLVRRSSRNNLTHHDLSERLQGIAKRVVNGFYLRHIQDYDSLDEIGGRIAFYPLHVQPEASIDVQGPFFSDQLKLIRDIRRSLPIDTTLIVKEHPNFLGQRGPGFFNRIRLIPNVKLLRHDVSTFEVYKRAAIVFTVTGTAAYEAGMLGIPAVTFTKMFFGGLSSVRHCPDISELQGIVDELLEGFRRDYNADCRFMSELMDHSYEGYWTDPFFDPSVMDPDNISKLSRAFEQVLSYELA